MPVCLLSGSPEPLPPSWEDSTAVRPTVSQTLIGRSCQGSEDMEFYCTELHQYQEVSVARGEKSGWDSMGWD